ncbi:MAG: tetratricopeptide repeat protein [Pseudomonadota bacterium]
MLRNTTQVEARKRQLISSVLALLLIGSATAHSHETDTHFEMTVIRNAAFGSKIAAGQTQFAIDKIEAARSRPKDRFFVKNNLCVAYTMTSDFDKAASECDAAVEAVQSKARHLDDIDSVIYARYTAMALSNRGVLRAMLGQPDKARTDFEQARKLPVSFSASRKNLEHLNIRTAQATVQ